MELFEPAFDEEQLYDILPRGIKNIDSSMLYTAVKLVTETAIPEDNRFGDKNWFSFYLPLRREQGIMAVPVKVTEVNVNRSLKKMIIRTQHSEIQVYRGDEQPSEELVLILAEIRRLIPYLQQDPSLPEKLVPYDKRTGRIQGKYVLKEVMSEQEREGQLAKYQHHLTRDLKAKSLSLDDYLSTAAIGYKAVMKKTEELSPLQMYERWADGRHEGMLDITDASDKDAFTKWYKSRNWGGHPFEIIYSDHNYGITLCPPSTENTHFSLNVGTTAYFKKYLAITSAFIEQGVPFQAPDYETVLEYLAGATTFTVNHFGLEGNVHYFHSDEEQEKYFSHITWDPLKIPQWKTE